MTYNHALNIAWAVPNSQYESWEDCLRNEKELVIAGLAQRIAEIMLNDREFQEAIDGFDSYEEE